jgi:hypothetical protein
VSTVSLDTQQATLGTGQQSMTELVSGIVSDAQRLFRQQLDMVKAEVKEDVRKTKQTALVFAAGGALIALGLILLSVALVYGLHAAAAPNLPLWACWAIVGGVIVALGGVALLVGNRILASYNPLPDKSLHALQENVSWIANRQS